MGIRLLFRLRDSLSEGKSPLVGMLMVDRPSRCPEDYIQDLKETFGEVIIGPMTINGERGLFTQMRIEDPYSLDLVKNDFSGPNMEETKYVLNLALKGGFCRSLSSNCTGQKRISSG